MLHFEGQEDILKEIDMSRPLLIGVSMLNRIWKSIGGLPIIIAGVTYGLLVYLFYGKEEVYAFCDFLESRSDKYKK